MRRLRPIGFGLTRRAISVWARCWSAVRRRSGVYAVRLGAAYDLFGSGRTLLRGAFGTFYDRPFDNLWENVRSNNVILPLLTLPAGPVNYLTPVASQLATFRGQNISSEFPDLTLVDPNLRNGYARS